MVTRQRLYLLVMVVVLVFISYIPNSTYTGRQQFLQGDNISFKHVVYVCVKPVNVGGTGFQNVINDVQFHWVCLSCFY